MPVFARADLAYIFVSGTHKGCGQPHSRPVEHGAPAKVWQLDCPQCSEYLRTDPNWSSTLSEVPETVDERLAREDFAKRGAFDRDAVMAMAMAKLAGVDLPETLRRPLTGVAPHIPTIAGEIECTAGHPNEPGSKYCAECGSPVRDAVLLCPDGHAVSVKAKFCAECGQPVTAVPAPEAVPAPAAAPSQPGRLKDMRAADLQKLAREKGLDDSGSRADLIGRLRTAAQP